jgi:hypothetical protein
MMPWFLQLSQGGGRDTMLGARALPAATIGGPDVDFDISKTAGSYAQMASVFTGFAFLAMTIVLSRRDSNSRTTFTPRQLDQDKRTVIALLCAFTGLLIATVEYSIVTGESNHALVEGRAASEELLAAVGFTVSMYILLYALVHLIATSSLKLGSEFRLLVTVFLPPIFIYFVTNGLMDVAIALGQPKPPLEPMWSTARTASIGLAIFTLLICGLLWNSSRKLRRKLGELPRYIKDAPPYVTLATTIIATMYAAQISDVNPAARLSESEAWSWVAIAAAVLIYVSASLSCEPGAELP